MAALARLESNAKSESIEIVISELFSITQWSNSTPVVIPCCQSNSVDDDDVPVSTSVVANDEQLLTQLVETQCLGPALKVIYNLNF